MLATGRTARSVLCPAPGVEGGTAIRLETPKTGRELCRSIALPGLGHEEVQARLEGRVALVPLRQSALLPLYSAPVDGIPVRGLADLTVVPSGNAHDLRRGTSVGLSACHLAGIGTRLPENKMMATLHEELRAGTPPSAALGKVVARAAADGFRPKAWGPRTHFGA
ncbi:hypothetical protein [Streptomyces ziwulingensis]|uniref:hypothetical protein n=1 Tax=Streptomyces ziwulingensis TaxID=1045501 RepID=UPI0031EA11BC